MHWDFCFWDKLSIRGFTSILLIVDARCREQWKFLTQSKSPPIIHPTLRKINNNQGIVTIPGTNSSIPNKNTTSKLNQKANHLIQIPQNLETPNHMGEALRN